MLRNEYIYRFYWFCIDCNGRNEFTIQNNKPQVKRFINENLCIELHRNYLRLHSLARARQITASNKQTFRCAEFHSDDIAFEFIYKSVFLWLLSVSWLFYSFVVVYCLCSKPTCFCVYASKFLGFEKWIMDCLLAQCQANWKRANYKSKDEKQRPKLHARTDYVFLAFEFLMTYL